MITVDFLPAKSYYKYGDWLKSQDNETLNMYFGVACTPHYIDLIVEQILTSPDNHEFVVARNGREWVGVIHLAYTKDQVEFGVTVAKDSRNQGIASQMMDKAILRARNRGYQELYMHCLSWNIPIKRLCHKYDLKTHSADGESEVLAELPPRNWFSINREIALQQQTLLTKIFNRTNKFYLSLFSFENTAK